MAIIGRNLIVQNWDTFYNVQPCCVFPENHGRKFIHHDEAKRLIEKYGYAENT